MDRGEEPLAPRDLIPMAPPLTPNERRERDAAQQDGEGAQLPGNGFHHAARAADGRDDREIVVAGLCERAKSGAIVGVDGPRWMLRGIFSGPAAEDPKSPEAEILNRFFSDIVVDRGEPRTNGM